MSADHPRPARREDGSGALLSGMALGAGASVVALWPYTSVLAPGMWTAVITALVISTALTGLMARGLTTRLPGGASHAIALGAQLVVGAAVVTAFLAPDTMIGPLPTIESAERLFALADQGLLEVSVGTAPLPDSAGIRALMGMSFLVLVVLLDQLVALRRGLLTVVLVAVVGALPMIITRGDANVVWFAVLGVLAIVLLWRGARGDRGASEHPSGGVATAVGAAGLTIALVATPLLPISSTWAWSGGGIAVDATLRLGEDLRRPTPVDVMTLATNASSAPYLRIATLSEFDGEQWHPDELETQPLSEGFGEHTWPDDVEGTPQQTSIRVLTVSSDRLPVPYPAIRLVGAGAQWQAVPANRTVLSRTADASDADYTVTTATVDPTLEQVRAARTGGVRMPETPELPAAIIDLAQTVTADADNDYDRLIALQRWFRTAFQYSLDTPVEEDFDGTGIDAVETFLDVRSGYCVHFAGAFALMAASLDMPVRIVVGYLPGAPTDERRGDETIFTVASDKLHAWPEVHFEGLGWIPFEPTASLGVPTAFAPAATDGGPGDGGATPAPTTAPGEAEPTAAAPEAGPTTAPTSGASALRQVDPSPVMFTVLGAIVVLLLPAVFRRTRRGVRLAAARRGDASAAWTELRDTLVDLRLPVSDADTARRRAAGLVHTRGADAAALERIVGALERAGYAREPGEQLDLSRDLAGVLKAVEASVDGRERVHALLLPRSLVAQRQTV